MKYSDFAHIPFGIAITVAAVILYRLGVPVSYIGALGAVIFEFTRQEAKREYQIMEEKGILRAQLNTIDAWKFWNWNKHGKMESLATIVSSLAVATGVFLVFGV